MTEQLEKEPSLEETLEKAKSSLERARASTGRDRVEAICECDGIFIDAGLRPEDLQKIDTSAEELKELMFQGDKEEAIELFEKARSSRGRERIDAAERCKYMLESEASKRKEVEAFTPEDVGTTLQELDKLISQGEKEKL